jgi:hypothetical protein
VNIKSSLNAFANFLIICATILIVLILITLSFFVFFDLYLFCRLCMHEFGHMIGSVLTDILSGNPIQPFHLNNTISSPLLHLPMPQQTTTERISVLILYGGMYFGFIVASIICGIICFYYRTKNWIFVLFAFPISLLIIEVVSNYYCGSDNLSRVRLAQCDNNLLINWIWQWGDVVFIIALMILFWGLLAYYIKRRIIRKPTPSENP